MDGAFQIEARAVFDQQLHHTKIACGDRLMQRR